MTAWSAALRQRVPPKQRTRIQQRLRRLRHPPWLALYRTTPLSDHYGYDRGTPIDRYYIGRFLEDHRGDIHGGVLEVMDTRYTTEYGTAVTSVDVLDVDPSNSRATVVADLSAADAIPSDHYDCLVLTQTLQFICDTRAALVHARRILRPGGVLLATVPGISKVDPPLAATDYWRFTVSSCSLLTEQVFGPGTISITVYGNVLTAIGSLTGMAAEELSHSQLDTDDRYFPVIIGVRAVKDTKFHENS